MAKVELSLQFNPDAVLARPTTGCKTAEAGLAAGLAPAPGGVLAELDRARSQVSHDFDVTKSLIRIDAKQVI